jgi:hypothetical protein
MEKKLIWLLLITTCAGVVQAQIGVKAKQNSSLIGIWHNNQFGYQMTLLLNEDGTGEFDGEAIRYTSQANKLVIVQNGQSTTYTYELVNNSLNLSGGDIDGTISFTKPGGETAPQKAEGKVEQSVGRELIGQWSGYGETIEFKSDGQCSYLGQTYPYSVGVGQVTLTTQQGPLPMAYRVNGNELQLTLNGRSFTYTKGSGTSNAGGNGAVAQELVGKWCYVNVTTTNTGGVSSDECITLNGDGTYSYYSERSTSVNTNSFSGGTASQNSDQGTWMVKGNRIFYTSPTRGQGSYELQRVNHPKTGDPMIVLDGTAYVTFYQKQPWR